ncbi:MAG: flagellar hook-basal body complex protein FliE [Candidatus Muirbacterium halophilum]|nr:flagellar hook-basal body complex protein FliE [Candidatus Muirbacterium halophilum]MCK9474347.1 flagellar hook-basal body complex protein FliE [Candidatus Muirbacterium halophilum]
MNNVINPNFLTSQGVNTKSKPVSKVHNRDMMQDFKTLFQDNVNKTINLQKQSADMTQKMVAGDVEDIHQVMVAAEKAKIAFKFTLEVKNKIMTAFQEVQRMQI